MTLPCWYVQVFIRNAKLDSQVLNNTVFKDYIYTILVSMFVNICSAYSCKTA